MSFTLFNLILILVFSAEVTGCQPRTGLSREQGHPNVSAVPRHLSRFDIPWRVPIKPKMPTLQESRNRVLYSGVREGVSDGLGHGMSTVNADVATAIRLGVTYTHRMAKYGSLVGTSFTRELRRKVLDASTGRSVLAGLSEENAKVEAFFGWGVDEIAREAVQEEACPVANEEAVISKCKLCKKEDVLRAKKRRGNGTGNGFIVDEVVEIPMELSYRWPHRRTASLDASLDAFLRINDRPNTVFHMPHSVCNSSPTYSKFDPMSRGYFYHKYWDLHARYPDHDRRRIVRLTALSRLYVDGWTKSLTIPAMPGRGTLTRLREHELTIAIHARRGDFFHVGRPMVSTSAFARVVRAVLSEVRGQGGPFSWMPVAINIYSEGRPAAGFTETVGHNIARLTNNYHDSDGKVLTEEEVTAIFRDKSMDDLADVFPNGMRVSLRVSEDTVMSLHEMIASDIFVGSKSAMSQHVLGSLARGAMQFLPIRAEQPDEWDGHVRFDQATGNIPPKERELVSKYWREFCTTNNESAARALRTRRRFHSKQF